MRAMVPFTMPPVPALAVHRVDEPDLLNVTRRWDALFASTATDKTGELYYNRTAGWTENTSLVAVFFAICEVLFELQGKILSFWSADWRAGFGDAESLWLAFTGLCQWFSSRLHTVTRSLPAPLLLIVDKWVPTMVSALEDLRDQATGLAKHVAGAGQGHGRLAGVIHAVLMEARYHAVVWPYFFEHLFTLHNHDGETTRWFFHADLGASRQSVIANLARSINETRPRVVEIGVADASTSAFLIQTVPGIRLLGLDPYMEFRSGAEGRTESYDEGGGGDLAFAKARRNYDRAVIRSRSTERGRPEQGPNASALLIRSTSADAARSLDLWTAGWHEMDVLFIDAEKTYDACVRDILLWGPRVSPWGCVSGHDFSATWMGTVSCVLDTLPRGATLHLAPDSTWWWCKDGYAPGG